MLYNALQSNVYREAYVIHRGMTESNTKHAPVELCAVIGAACAQSQKILPTHQ